jgi:predicted Zn-dependent protease
MKKSFPLIALIPLATVRAGDTHNVTPSIDHTRGLHRYFWANYEHFAGNSTKAQEWYNDIINASTSSVYTYKGYIAHLYQIHNYGAIVRLIDKLDGSFQDDPDIQLIFALSVRQTGNTAQSDERLVRLSERFKDHTEIIFHTVEALVQKKELENALVLIDNFLNTATKRPNGFIFHFLKAQLCAQLGKVQEARQHITICLDKHPRFDKGWLLFALIQEQVGQIGEAIRGYSSYLQLSGDNNEQIKHHLLQLSMRQKALESRTQVLNPNADAYDKALSLMKLKKYDEALAHLDRYLAAQPDDPAARTLKVQILIAATHYDQLFTALKTWLTQEPTNQLCLQTLKLLARTEIPLATLTNFLESMKTQDALRITMLTHLADLYARNKQPEKALECYEQLRTAPIDRELKAKVCYQIAAHYYDKGNYTAMLPVLLEGIGAQPSFAPLNNLLAYHYASEGKELDKAQQYIDIALKNQTRNPHFLDTQALIHLKRGSHAQALAVLETIIKQIPQDPTVQLHLAQALAQQGEVKRALGFARRVADYTHNADERTTAHALIEQLKNKAT